MRIRAIPFQCFDSPSKAVPLLHVTNPRIALAFLCALTLYFAIPSRYVAGPFHAIAFPGASRRLVPMPSHRVSLFLNTSPSLCKTSPSSSVAALRQSPLFHCVAEIRIAPQSLCCSSGSKTELSLSYAVLGRAALRLAFASLCAAKLGLAFSQRRKTPLRLCCGRQDLRPPFPPGRSFPPASALRSPLPFLRGFFLPRPASYR